METHLTRGSGMHIINRFVNLGDGMQIINRSVFERCEAMPQLLCLLTPDGAAAGKQVESAPPTQKKVRHEEGGSK